MSSNILFNSPYLVPFRPFCVRCPCSYSVTLRHLKLNSYHNNNNNNNKFAYCSFMVFLTTDMQRGYYFTRKHSDSEGINYTCSD